MPYRFKASDKSVEDGLRRIAIEQIDRGLAELDDGALAADKKIHQMRKRIKKLRGLLRLVRPGFAAFSDENDALREAGKRLSAMRDSDVLLATHDALIEANALEAGDYDSARRSIIARKPSATPDTPDHGEALAAFRVDLVALRERAAHWSVYGKGRKVLAKGMEKTLKRGRKAMTAAEQSRSDEDLHEWRKRVKYHWYHCRLMSDIRPGRLKERAELSGALGENLGDHHDLAVYAEMLASAEPGAEIKAQFDELLGLARQRQIALEDEAFAQGAELFRDRPKKVRKRWTGWWQDWQKAA